MTAIKARRIFCGQCARLKARGTYLRCTLGCGTALCRKGRCAQQHTPNCPQRATTYTDSPQQAS